MLYGTVFLTTDRIEKIQIESLRVISGLTVSCPTAKLRIETGYETLKMRRFKHRLVMLYKIRNNLSHPYLSDLLPDTLDNMHGYKLRNAGDYHPFQCHTASFQNSFFSIHYFRLERIA